MSNTQTIYRWIAGPLMGAALFIVIGGPLPLLQCVAWSTMVRDFSRNGTLTQAVEKTFDGRHPCPLCKKIAKARAAQEKAPATVKIEKKAEGFFAQSASSIPLPVCRPLVYTAAPLVEMPERSDAPPVPVPRDSFV